jgi:uncharacterized YigZ family protein
LFTFQTIASPVEAEFTDRGSRFIAYAFPIDSVESFKKNLQQLKEQHPKAVHHCFAYRLGTDKTNFRSSDDGEPSGSAGKPILNQLDSFGVTNVLVVVVRYFGGILLGVPGLINAYKVATQQALRSATIETRSIEKLLWLQCDYTTMNDVMQWIKYYQLTVVDKQIDLFCTFKIKVPLEKEVEIITRFQKTNSEFKFISEE